MPKGILLSLLITAIGVAWLLNTLHFIGGVDWIWTIALAGAGIVSFAVTKLNKISFIFGAFLVVASIFSVLRQTGLITLEVEVPILVIVFGILFMIAQSPMIPLPQSIAQMKEEAKRENP
jgi:predicted membrane protein